MNQKLTSSKIIGLMTQFTLHLNYNTCPTYPPLICNVRLVNCPSARQSDAGREPAELNDQYQQLAGSFAAASLLLLEPRMSSFPVRNKKGSGIADSFPSRSLPPAALYPANRTATQPFPEQKLQNHLSPHYLCSPPSMCSVNYTTSCVLVWTPLIPRSCHSGDPLTLSSGQCGDPSNSSPFSVTLPILSWHGFQRQHSKNTGSRPFLRRDRRDCEPCDENVIVKQTYPQHLA